LKQNPGAITCTRISANRTAMSQIGQQIQALTDNAMAFLAFDMNDKTNATRIVLIARIIQTLSAWLLNLTHYRPPKSFNSGL
jgi:hypothetical protein